FPEFSRFMGEQCWLFSQGHLPAAPHLLAGGEQRPPIGGKTERHRSAVAWHGSLFPGPRVEQTQGRIAGEEQRFSIGGEDLRSLQHVRIHVTEGGVKLKQRLPRVEIP